MEEKSFMERATDPALEEKKRNMIENNMTPFLGELSRRMTRAKVLSYIDAVPEGETIDAEDIAARCETDVDTVRAIIDEVMAEREPEE